MRAIPPPFAGAVPILLPALGWEEGAVVACWLAELDEAVEEGEGIVEALAPGVTVEVPAPATGVLRTIVKPADARARTGDVLGWIERA